MSTPTARKSLLTKLAALLSAGSLVWTTWSLFDLLGAGPAGITVAVCADAVWGSVIYAEYRGVRLAGRRWLVALFGWLSLIAVVVFLIWHGLADNNLAMAFAGPFLPLGAKVVWALALADMRDPAALTDAEKAALAKIERGLVFEEAQHAIEMRRRTMHAELLIAEVSTDFDIEVMRQDRARELQRRAPITISQQPEQPPSKPAVLASKPSEHTANTPLNRPNPAREQPTIAELVREQIAITEDNATAVRNVLAVRPDANKESVAAAVRRERKKAGPYL